MRDARNTRCETTETPGANCKALDEQVTRALPRSPAMAVVSPMYQDSCRGRGVRIISVIATMKIQSKSAIIPGTSSVPRSAPLATRTAATIPDKIPSHKGPLPTEHDHSRDRPDRQAERQ